MVYKNINTRDAQRAVIDALLAGELVVVKTDTIYGILALANSKQAVDSLYAVRDRDEHKPCIVLVASCDDAYGDDSTTLQSVCDVYDIATPTSIIVPSQAPQYLTRGGETLAYRVVSAGPLSAIIRQVGPVLAPSANKASCPPAKTITEAIHYFGDAVRVYVDDGTVVSTPSRLVRARVDGTVEQLR